MDISIDSDIPGGLEISIDGDTPGRLMDISIDGDIPGRLMDISIDGDTPGRLDIFIDGLVGGFIYILPNVPDMYYDTAVIHAVL